MSSVITLSTSEAETIHGTLAAAKSYIGMTYGPTYDAWIALVGVGGALDDPKKKTLAAAVRLLNSQVWTADYDTFAKRDLIPAFETAQYELAVLVLDDPDILGLADQGSNIQNVAAGSASVTFFNPTTRGAQKLPPVLMRLVGRYLAAGSGITATAGWGQSGSCVDPMSACEQDKRGKPY
jgi:hypothetical protein